MRASRTSRSASRTQSSSRTRLRSTALAAALALVAAPLAALPAAAAEPVTLNLLTMNDFHGRIDPAITVKFAGTVEQLRAAGGEDNTLLVSGGDNVSASLFASAVQNDQPTIDVLNALGLDVSAVGNHEFDRGYADLTDRIIAGGTNAKWDYLGANVYRKGTQTPALPAYATFVKAGLTVGVIGAVTEETPTLVSPAGVADLDFGDPVDAVNRVADELTDGDPANGEADILVATFHEGADNVTKTTTLEQATAASAVFDKIANRTSAKVSVIVNAHTHQTYAWSGPVPGSTTGATRPIIQTGNYGDNVGQIKLSVDPDTKTVTSFTVANVPRLTTDDATLVATYPRVATIKTIVDAAVKFAAAEGNKPVGSITADITTAFTGTTRDDRGSESTLGGTVANALRDKLSAPDLGAAEIGVVNPGGLRSELLYAGNTATNPANTDGVVTYAEANAVLPFVNNLWTTTLTGAQFVTLLEQQWQRALPGETPPSRAYLQLGLSDNVSYTFHEITDPDTPTLKKGVIDSVTIDGLPLDPAASYRIGTFSFLTAGGDNFRIFRSGTDARDTGLIDRDAWIAYLQEHPGLAPSFARRAVLVSNQPTTVDAGASVTFGLAKLDLTSLGSPANTSLTVSLEPATGDAIPVGTYPVSAGAATVTMTAPAAGRYTVVAKATPSGTTVRFPITVKAVVPPPSVQVTAAAVANDRERVVVKVTAKNTDTVPLTLVLTTDWGAATFTDVAPGATVAKRFATRQSSVPAGSATVTATKTVDGQTLTKEFTAPYAGLSATQRPRGYVETEAYLDARGEVVFKAYWVNLGGDPVQVRLRTPYGNSTTKTVKPLRTGILTVRTEENRTKRVTGDVVATKVIGGKEYSAVFVVRFPATR